MNIKIQGDIALPGQYPPEFAAGYCPGSAQRVNCFPVQGYYDGHFQEEVWAY